MIELVSRASFGIYLVHYAVIDLFQSPFIAMSQLGALGYSASVSILSVIVFGATFLYILAVTITLLSTCFLKDMVSSGFRIMAG